MTKNIESIHQFKKGSLIFKETDPANKVGLIVKGRVLIYNKGMKMIANSGNFLAINDFKTGRYQSSYLAFQNTTIYIFDINRKTPLEDILSLKKEYNGLMIASNSYKISKLAQTYQGLIGHGNNLKNFIEEKTHEYKEVCNKLGYEVKGKIENDNIPLMENNLQKEKTVYYTELSKIPIDKVEEFYSYGQTLAIYQIKDQISLINQLIEQNKKLAVTIIEMGSKIFGEVDSSLFFLIADLGFEIQKAGGSNEDVIDKIDEIVYEINEVEKFFDEQVGSVLGIDRTRMEEVYYLLLNNESKEMPDKDIYLKYSVKDSSRALEEMAGAINKIMDYGEIPEELSQKTNKLVLDYINLRDKNSSDDETRNIRKNIREIYYKVYKKVFLKAYEDVEVPRIIDMFLIYGFIDERLLKQGEQLALYFLEETKGTGPCNVYNIKEWLIQVYEGKKEPSKNEFDLDYRIMLLEEKKRNRIDDKKMQELLKDNMNKLKFEIENMFKTNHRLVSGELAVFVPILHSGIFIKTIEQAAVTKKEINKKIKEVLEIDFSVFQRESLYSNEEKGIKQEQIIGPVYPDIILMPTHGDSPIMWQEITGRKRNSKGRFLFPTFTSGDLSKMMVKTLGRFRWEVCRTEQGLYWNDIRYKSLTSEYSDYLQFYRKNRELSEKNKEKLKRQIQKGRNNNREIFVMDYELWVNNESQGGIRLNFLVREIMATYCPFTKELREKLGRQPLFEEAMAKGHRERIKKIREIEGRIGLLKRERLEIPQELIDTLAYYKES